MLIASAGARTWFEHVQLLAECSRFDGDVKRRVDGEAQLVEGPAEVDRVPAHAQRRQEQINSGIDRWGHSAGGCVPPEEREQISATLCREVAERAGHRCEY